MRDHEEIRASVYSAKALGGVKAAVSQLAQKGFNWPSIQQTGGAFRDLGAELIGVAGVSEYWFN